MKLQAFGHVLEIKHYSPANLEKHNKRNQINAWVQANPDKAWSHVSTGGPSFYGQHIARTKAARALWDLGLKEAKDLADELWPESRR